MAGSGTSIAANLPGGPANVIREDPKKKRTSSTAAPIMESMCPWTAPGPGIAWALGCPTPRSGTWQVHPRDNMLVIATNGRGMWAIDDVVPLQNAAR